MTLESRIEELEAIVRSHLPLVVAYSGGVDSTCLLAVATRVGGERVLGVIADSPSLPRQALASALDVARGFGAAVETLRTAEFENEEYLSNPPNRCYFCKAELFAALQELARRRGFAALAYGENADDPPDQRPGSRAAAEFSVLAPLRMAGLTKSDVREISRKLGLATYDAPAQPCLSSRIPHGTRVTASALAMVEQGEAFIRALGFQVFRVRYIEGPPIRARLQVAPGEMERLAGIEDRIALGLRAAGFDSVEIDPNGYR